MTIIYKSTLLHFVLFCNQIKQKLQHRPNENRQGQYLLEHLICGCKTTQGHIQGTNDDVLLRWWPYISIINCPYLYQCTLSTFTHTQEYIFSYIYADGKTRLQMLEYIYGRMKKHSIYLAQVNILFMYFVMNLLECSKKFARWIVEKR